MSRLTDALCALGELMTGATISGDTVAEIIEKIAAEYPSSAQPEIPDTESDPSDTGSDPSDPESDDPDSSGNE